MWVKLGIPITINYAKMFNRQLRNQIFSVTSEKQIDMQTTNGTTRTATYNTFATCKYIKWKVKVNGRA